MLVSAARRLAPAGSSSDEGHVPLVIAHRGATQRAPENSLAAFEAAIAARADMVELDVRSTADDLLVVHHDSTSRGIPISLLTFDQLRERREAVTSLADALALCRSRINVDVEIKRPGLEQPVIDLIEHALDPEQVVVTSFHESVIASAKQSQPRLICGLLLGLGMFRARVRQFRENPFEWLDRSGADFVLPHHLMVPIGRIARATTRPSLLSRLAARGTKVVVWTVNRPDRLSGYLTDPRVAGVVTDAPELASELRSEAMRAPYATAVTGRTGQPFPNQVRPHNSE